MGGLSWASRSTRAPATSRRARPRAVASPTAGEYTLRVLTTFDQGTAAFPREAPVPVTQDVEVRVR
ncbi:MAG TPA: hypothetical protein VMK65_01310 [Longimicrobiales bacterium]|nr:hypothetical protein [Longimicrobiales bacterium]